MNTTTWQYSEADITIPSNCAYVLGSPKVTLGGLKNGAAVNMDEVTFAPYRAALIIGARAPTGIDGLGHYTATDWILTNWKDSSMTTYNIGPLQSDKEFYDDSGGQPLPSSWDSGNNACYEIEQSIPNSAEWPACVIAYLTQRNESQFATFFQGLPAAQIVIMVYHQEPEGDYSSGSQFVSGFEAQSQNIRAAAAYDHKNSNVFVAMDSSTGPLVLQALLLLAGRLDVPAGRGFSRRRRHHDPFALSAVRTTDGCRAGWRPTVRHAAQARANASAIRQR